MKRRYWAILAGAYSTAMIVFFVYRYSTEKRFEEPSISYSHVICTTEPTIETEPASTTVTARSQNTRHTTTSASTTMTEAVTVSTTAKPSTSTAISTTHTTTGTTAATTTAVTTATTATTTTGTTATTVSFPLDLNTATVEQLCALPDIGEMLAQAIVDYRTQHGSFTNRRQLLDIYGIGESRYTEICDLLYIDNELPMPESTALPVQTAPPETQAPTEPPETTPPETEPLYINLNTADQAALLQLPGCEESVADAILRLRGDLGVFHNPAELLLLEDKAYNIANCKSLYEQWKAFLFVDDNGGRQLP